MKIKLKTVSTILVILIMASTLASCSSISPSMPGEDVVEVTYWHMWTSDWKILIDGLVAEFNETHPNIHVTARSITGDPNAMFLTSVAGGSPPDVMTQWNQVIPSWAERGAILPLDDFMATDAPDLREWMYPIVADIGTYNDQMYAVPFSMNTFMMFYNKDIMAEEGFDVDAPPETIEEMDSMQDQLWEIDDRGFIQRVGLIPSNVTMWAPAFGGEWVDHEGNPTATHENNIRTLEWFESYVDQFGSDRIAAFNQSMDSNVNMAWPFLTGHQVFAVDGMWRLEDLKAYAPDLEYGIAPLPYPEEGGKPNASWVNGNYNIIPAGAENPEEAWTFILWLTGYGNEEWAAQMLPEGGWIPASPTIAEQEAYQEFMNEIPERRQFVDLLQSENVQITPVIPIQNYYWDRAGSAEEAVRNQNKTPEEALADLQREVEEELERQRVLLGDDDAK